MTGGTRRMPLWQRNLIGAALAAAALGVLVVVDLWPEWALYRATVVPAHVVAPRQSLTVDGQAWTVADVRHLRHNPTPGARPLPEGTVLRVVTVGRSGPQPPDYYLVGVLTDDQRRWRGERLTTQPDRMAWNFVIPGDAVPTALDITMSDGATLIRLQL